MEIIAKNRKAADTLNQNLSAWTFVIASHNGDAMLTTRQQLVKKKEIPEPAETERPVAPEELSENASQAVPVATPVTETSTIESPASGDAPAETREATNAVDPSDANERTDP